MIPPLPIFSDLVLGDPIWLSLIPLALALPWVIRKINPSHTFLKFSLFGLLKQARSASPKPWFGLPNFFYKFGVILILLALARPQLDQSTETILSSGVDIVIAVDLSASMLALDMSESDSLNVTRLDVIKDVISEFINKRKYDRIGLVAFAVDPYLVSALTLDQEHLQKNLARLRVGRTE